MRIVDESITIGIADRQTARQSDAGILPGPSKRTKQHNQLMTSWMNAHRLKGLETKSLEKQNYELQRRLELADESTEKYRYVPSKKAASVSFCSTRCLSSMAREYNMSRQHAQHIVMCTASCIHASLTMVFEGIKTVMRDVEFSVGWEKLKFDESDKRLSLDVMTFLDKHQRIATWHICVQQRVVGFITAAGEFFEIHVPCQPIILVGSQGSSTLYDALLKRAHLKFLYSFIAWLVSKCIDFIRLREADNAKNVAKVLRHERVEGAADNIYDTYHACARHQSALSLKSVMKHHYKNLQATLHAYSSLRRMGNFWIRTLLSIGYLTEICVQVVFGIPRRALSCIIRL